MNNTTHDRIFFFCLTCMAMTGIGSALDLVNPAFFAIAASGTLAALAAYGVRADEEEEG
jgi:hypothetical protein